MEQVGGLSAADEGQVISYNDVVFGNEARVAGMVMKPNYDAARRVVAWTDYTFTLVGYFGFGANVPDGQTLNNIRRRLQLPGGNLILQGIGQGIPELLDFNSQLADVRYGPRPTSISWRETGGGRLWECTLVVEVSVGGECLTGALLPDSLKNLFLEFTFELNWTIDTDRYTRRTYSCTARVPAVRKDAVSTNLVANADLVREKCTPPMPSGYRRDTDTWVLSPDKTELKGTVIDVQLPPNVPPPYVTTAEASHSIESTVVGFSKWNFTLRASYTIPPSLGRAVVSLRAFTKLLEQRLALIDANLGTTTTGGINIGGTTFTGLGITKSCTIIPNRFSIEEPEIYGRRSSAFSFGASVVVSKNNAGGGPRATLSSNAGFMLEISGLWTPTNQDENVWKRSLQNEFGPRGHGGMRFQDSNDALISLCNDNSPATIPTLGGGGFGGVAGVRALIPQAGGVNAGAEEDPDEVNAIQDLFDKMFPPVKPDASYLDYQVELDIRQVDNVAVMQLLPTEPVVYQPPTVDPALSTLGMVIPYKKPRQNPFIVQYRGVPLVFVTLRGYAARAAYECTPARLISVGGIDAIPYNTRDDYCRTRTMANLLVPVQLMSWQFTYLIPGVPGGGIPTPHSPIVGGPLPSATNQPADRPGIEGFSYIKGGGGVD